TNALGGPGAVIADLGVQSLGVGAGLIALLMVLLGLSRATSPDPDFTRRQFRPRSLIGAVGVLAAAGALALPAPPVVWPLARGLGGLWGDGILHALGGLFAFVRIPAA